MAEALPATLETCARPLFLARALAGIGDDTGETLHPCCMHEYVLRVGLPIGGDVQVTARP